MTEPGETLPDKRRDSHDSETTRRALGSPPQMTRAYSCTGIDQAGTPQNRSPSGQ